MNIERNHIPLFLSFRISDNENDWKYIRTAVFIEEQGFINEFDDIDHSAVHLCAYLNDTAVGCLRFFPERNDASVWHLGRVAVLPPLPASKNRNSFSHTGKTNNKAKRCTTYTARCSESCVQSLRTGWLSNMRHSLL